MTVESQGGLVPTYVENGRAYAITVRGPVVRRALARRGLTDAYGIRNKLLLFRESSRLMTADLSAGAASPPQSVAADRDVLQAAWSPDGRTIAFLFRRQDAGGVGLGLVDLSSGKVDVVADEPAVPDYLVWLRGEPGPRYLGRSQSAAVGLQLRAWNATARAATTLRPVAASEAPFLLLGDLGKAGRGPKQIAAGPFSRDPLLHVVNSLGETHRLSALPVTTVGDAVILVERSASGSRRLLFNPATDPALTTLGQGWMVTAPLHAPAAEHNAVPVAPGSPVIPSSKAAGLAALLARDPVADVAQQAPRLLEWISDAGSAFQIALTRFRLDDNGDEVYAETVYQHDDIPGDLRTATIPDGALTPGGRYRWSLRARDAAGDWTAWSSRTSFFDVPLAAPLEASLTSGGADASSRLEWSPVEGAAGYAVFVLSADAEQRWITYSQSAVGATSMDLPYFAFGSGGAYEIAVVAFSSDGVLAEPKLLRSGHEFTLPHPGAPSPAVIGLSTEVGSSPHRKASGGVANASADACLLVDAVLDVASSVTGQAHSSYYASGKKLLFGISRDLVSVEGLWFDVGLGSLSVLLDLDDLNGMTGEGTDGWVTYWVDADFMLSVGRGLPHLGLSVLPIIRDPAPTIDDPRRQAEITAFTAAIGGIEFDLLNIDSNGFQVLPDGASYSSTLYGFTFLDTTLNLTRGELNKEVLKQLLCEAVVAAVSSGNALDLSLLRSEFLWRLVDVNLFKGEIRLKEDLKPFHRGFTSSDDPAPGAYFGPALTRVRGGVDVTGDAWRDNYVPLSPPMGGRPSTIYPLFVDLRSDDQTELDLYIQVSNVPAGWSIEALEADGAPAGAKYGPFPAANNGLFQTQWQIGALTSAPAEATVTFELYRDRLIVPDEKLDEVEVLFSSILPTPPPSEVRLTVGGNGAGSVSSSPPGFSSCTSTCTADFSAGTTVLLTPAANPGSTFGGWTGGGPCAGTGSCSFVVSGNTDITSSFTLDSSGGSDPGVNVISFDSPVVVEHPSTINVRVLDGSGQPVAAGTPVAFSTTFDGIFSGNGATPLSNPAQVLTDAGGYAWIRFTPFSAGSAHITVTSLSAEANLTIEATEPGSGSPLSLEVFWTQQSGSSSQAVYEGLFRVHDQGSPLPLGTDLQFSVNHGALAADEKETPVSGDVVNTLTLTAAQAALGDEVITVQVPSFGQTLTHVINLPVGDPAAIDPVFTSTLVGTSADKVTFPVAFSPDGTMAAVSSVRSVVLYSLPDLTILRTINLGLDDVNSVAFSPDSTWVAVGDDSGWVSTIHAATGSSTSVLRTTGRVGILNVDWYGADRLAIATEGKSSESFPPQVQILSGSLGLVKTIELSSNDPDDDTERVQCSRNLQVCAAAAFGSPRWYLFHPETGAIFHTEAHPDNNRIYALAFNEAGNRFFVGGDDDSGAVYAKLYSISGNSASQLPQPISLNDDIFGAAFITDSHSVELLTIAGNQRFEVFGSSGGPVLKARAFNPPHNESFYLDSLPGPKMVAAIDRQQQQLFAFGEQISPSISTNTPSPLPYGTSSYTLTGAIQDDSAIASAEYSVNGGASMPLTLGPSGGFSIALRPLVPGNTVVVIAASDILGNSSLRQAVVVLLGDQDPPLLGSLGVHPGTTTPGQPIGLSIVATDAGAGVGSVVATVRDAGSAAVQTVALAMVGPGAWGGTVDTTGMTVGAYTIDVVVGDLGTPANSVVALSAGMFSLSQPCSYSILPTSKSVSSAGGTGSFEVAAPAGCGWTATENLSWMTITSGASGVGNETVTYSVAANSTASAHNGTVSLKDANGATVGTHVVSQAASATTPASVSSSPASGSGLTQQFAFTFRHPGGWQNLQVLNVLINDFLDGRNACYLAYVPSSATSGALYLVNDAGDAGGPYAFVALPSSEVAGNSQCMIDGNGSSASTSGDTLTLTLSIGFKSAFAGDRIIYLAARDGAGYNSGWSALGSWLVLGEVLSGPNPISVAPSRSIGSGQKYTFVFEDTNGWHNLGVVNILINDFLDGRNACYLAYSAPADQLYVVNDAGDALEGGLANSQCSVTGVTAAGGGNTLTLSLDLAFSPGFAGDRVVYTAARSVGDVLNSGWKAKGSITVLGP